MENINTMLISGIAFGTILILIAMCLNIKNGIKTSDKQKIFFSENGVAGFVFYCTILIAVVYFYLKRKINCFCFNFRINTSNCTIMYFI